MENVLKHAVSRSRKRYVKQNFDLDLTYIMPNIIAMSFPAEKLEAIFENHIDDVARFLEQMHGGYYKVYNLCSERAYDPRKFHGRVARYPIDDHNPPPITMMKPFCEDVDRWLSLNPRNVVVIHCHAGKGRTGTMISAYMMYKRMFKTAENAVAYFEEKRLQPGARGVNPGQVRYVRYFERLIRENFVYSPKQLLLWAVEFNSKVFVDGAHCSPCFTVRHADSKSVFRSRVFSPKSGEHGILMKLTTPIVVSGDVKITFYHKRVFVGKRELFWLWFNTYFVGNTLEECYGLSAPDGFSATTPGFAPLPYEPRGGLPAVDSHRLVPCSRAIRNDGSRPGSAFLVSTLNVGRPQSADGAGQAGRCVTVTMPETELDRSRLSSLIDIIEPGFAVKAYFTTLPGV